MLRQISVSSSTYCLAPCLKAEIMTLTLLMNIRNFLTCRLRMTAEQSCSDILPTRLLTDIWQQVIRKSPNSSLWNYRLHRKGTSLKERSRFLMKRVLKVCPSGFLTRRKFFLPIPLCVMLISLLWRHVFALLTCCALWMRLPRRCRISFLLNAGAGRLST